MISQILPPKIPVSNRHPAGMSVQEAVREIMALRQALREYEAAWAQLQDVMTARAEADASVNRIREMML